MMQRMMMLAALCGLLAMPACSGAQMQAGSASSSSVVAPADIYNKLLADQEKEFVDAADAMPADKFNYAPSAGEFKGVRTFAEQIKHVTGANYGFFAKWNLPNMKSPADIDKLSGKPEIMQALRDSFTFAHAAMSTLTAGNAFEPMGGSGGTRIGTATHALAHMMDHYGQMVEYLRMNGIVPPASRKSSM
jgi:uncharacterized damage-inducible protein DinB